MNTTEYSDYVSETSRVDPSWIAAIFGHNPDDTHDLEGATNAGEQLLAAIGMAGEAGELLEHYKKWLFHRKPIDLEAVAKEAGDVIWYLTLWCNATGCPLEYIMQKNKEKLDARRVARERQFADDARAA